MVFGDRCPIDQGFDHGDKEAVLLTITILFKRLAYNSFDSQGAQYNQRFNKTISIIFLVMLALTIMKLQKNRSQRAYGWKKMFGVLPQRSP